MLLFGRVKLKNVINFPDRKKTIIVFPFPFPTATTIAATAAAITTTTSPGPTKLFKYDASQ